MSELNQKFDTKEELRWLETKTGAAIFLVTMGGFASLLFVVPWFIQGSIKKVA